MKVIDVGRKLGVNPNQTAKLIEQFVPAGRFTEAGAGYRARMIARTETLHAARISSLEVYRTAPQVKEVIAFDGESDEECAARNGSTFTFDEAEAEANGTHPNCVLAFGPVI
jgi:SPP1 gp7 family putative phage head morphogenesis protein